MKLDTPSLLVLCFFLIVQSGIYVAALRKLTRLRQSNLSPKTKLQILHNEDILFDCGLYVGLGGTVFALMLILLGIATASLVAAYASTLFGILFVAILKIGHVRPLKNTLVLQVASSPDKP